MLDAWSESQLSTVPFRIPHNVRRLLTHGFCACAPA
jgi:hypothetical protein